MYSELTPRVLVGGFVQQNLDVSFLAFSGVTHIVNASDLPTSPIVSKQFRFLEMRGANRDGEQLPEYWPKLFGFTNQAVHEEDSKLYFHITPEIPIRPAFPVAVYAGLRALGYSRLQSRMMLTELHPILTWHEEGTAFVDKVFTVWAKEHGFSETCRSPVAHKAKPIGPVEDVPLADVLEGMWP